VGDGILGGDLVAGLRGGHGNGCGVSRRWFKD
jgi:hypothetical protein